MSTAVATRSLPERALESLRRAGNPFRNYFARNPDDEVCARYHVAELFARERDQLHGVVDLYRYDPTTHSEIVPVLGNKGAGKTHLLHSIKHGDGAWQLLVTPGVYQKDTDFLEYLLFQVIDTLLGGGTQKGQRPLEFVGEELVRGLLCSALGALTPAERLELFPASGFSRWTRKFGLGGSQAQERAQWLLDTLGAKPAVRVEPSLHRISHVVQRLQEAGLEPEKTCAAVCAYVERTAAHDTAGLMRRHVQQGFARAVLLGDEGDLASFLTYGFAELDFRVRPSRQDLVTSLFKTLMGVFRSLRIPVVVAFDQLEDLLLARRSDDSHRVAEAFFAGIVQGMHQIDGLCFLIFAERGLWNRFVPSLDGYIQDRLANPVHVPQYGTIKTLRLEAPSPELVRRVVEARLRPALEELPEFAELPSIFPFTDDQIERVAKTEPTLRDMLQQLRHLFDHLVYGTGSTNPLTETTTASSVPVPVAAPPSTNSVPPDTLPATVKSIIVVETTSDSHPSELKSGQGQGKTGDFAEIWEQEIRAARRNLEPDGALTGATRELQAGLGALLQVCHEHGVKVGPWRLQHVVPEWTFGDHPTYGAITIAHWVCKDGQPWKVGIGLFLGRGPAKLKDLAIKLAALDAEPTVIDHLILLRPDDDLTLSGKSKTLWQDAEKRGRHARLEAVGLDGFAVLYGFPRFLACLTESLPQGKPLPNLADLLQEKVDRLLEQLCMPVQGG